ncbi:Sugar or nucleoside kinase, ribokinase family [Nocardioides alpinus]|uniref:Carbohydrate kinase family protein n=1 Tax=Nocardioides alpinus TaxID=748909 RepID=A0A1I1BEC3_9ACTN|nr:carbohydrate kinase family protein [Nocardioides alpinus]PKH40467.1 carbohydrate kinase family protein [Nocardioides alpinus]SFB46853.1 Sugar or nucleoside kinase, ribokinase family [Nocardioides alpinus]
MTPRVLVVGPASCNEIIHLAALPEAVPGTHFAERSWATLGGTSAGKALNLASLGADVTLLTVLGTDDVARRVRRSLEAAGVRVISRESRSGLCERHVNLMAAGERVSIYAHLPEPVAEWTRADAAEHLAGKDVVVADLAWHARPWVAWAQDAGVPAWTDLHDFDGRSAFHAAFALADHVQLSSVAMPGWRDFAERSAADGTSVVVTHGAAGSAAVGPDGTWAEVPGASLDVDDTNGAGDAFFAGFLVARLAGADLTAALHAGAAQAAVCLAGPHLAGEVGGLEA